MKEEYIALFIPIVVVVSIALISIYYRRYVHNERMALIDRGINIYEHRPKKAKSYESFRAGVFFIGLGLGFFTGYLLERNSDLDALAYFVMLFIFGGLSLVVSHFAEQKMRKKDALAEKSNM
jgi:predicted MFS family arabinose efflux permease